MPRRRRGAFTALCLFTGLLLGAATTPHPAAQAAATSSGAYLRGAAPVGAAVGDRPNIVLITADDMRADDLQFMPRTKRLLGRAGVTFTDALSNYPLCCPARATLLTGQYSHNNGVRGNEYPYGGYRKFAESGAELETLPVWLERAGYYTGFIGKYLNHYGSTDPEQGLNGLHYVPPGWDEWNASVGRIMRYYCVTLNRNGVLRRYPGEYQTDLYTRLTEQFVSNYAGSGRPFFLWTSHLAPHVGSSPSSVDPCERGTGLPTPGAKRHLGMFRGLPLPVSPATNEADMSDKGTYMRSRGELDLGYQALVHEGRVEALQALDESVAATVMALKKQHVLGNTLIVFASDNGWLLGEHRAEKKILPYEESLTVPLLMRGPGVPSGVRRDQPVGLVDIPATALDVSGALPTKLQDGVSLLGMAADPSVLARRVMPIEAGPAPVMQSRYNVTQPDWYYRGARSTSFSYIAWQMDAFEDEELYDLDEDPFQLQSTAGENSPELVTLRRYSQLLATCAGETCVTELPSGTEDGVSAKPEGDTSGPRFSDVRFPKGWIGSTHPTVRYTVSDPTDPASSLRQWCSHQAIGCDGSATLRLPGEGVHDWTIQATDPAGNAGAAWGRIRVDLYRPVVRRLATRLAVTEGREAPVRWRVGDTGSGVASVDTRRRAAALDESFSRWVYPPRLQGRRTPLRRVTPPKGGGTVCLEVRAKDVAGHRSAWAGLTCRARALDAAGLGDPVQWKTRPRDGWYGGTATVSRERGATLTVPSRGGIGLVRVVARTGPGMGALRVSAGDQDLRRVRLDRPTAGLVELLVPGSGASGPVTVTVVSTDKPVCVDSVGVVRRAPR